MKNPRPAFATELGQCRFDNGDTAAIVQFPSAEASQLYWQSQAVYDTGAMKPELSATIGLISVQPKDPAMLTSLKSSLGISPDQTPQPVKPDSLPTLQEIYSLSNGRLTPDGVAPVDTISDSVSSKVELRCRQQEPPIWSIQFGPAAGLQFTATPAATGSAGTADSKARLQEIADEFTAAGYPNQVVDLCDLYDSAVG